MNAYLLIFLFFIYFLFEFIASFGFNLKIKLIKQESFFWASLLGAISTMLFVFMVSFASFFSLVGSGEVNSNFWWFIFAVALVMALANSLSLILLRPFEKYLEKRKKRKEENDGDNLHNN